VTVRAPVRAPGRPPPGLPGLLGIGAVETPLGVGFKATGMKAKVVRLAVVALLALGVGGAANFASLLAQNGNAYLGQPESPLLIVYSRTPTPAPDIAVVPTTTASPSCRPHCSDPPIPGVAVAALTSYERGRLITECYARAVNVIQFCLQDVQRLP